MCELIRNGFVDCTQDVKMVAMIKKTKDVVVKLKEGKPTPIMPVLFVGHGNPMNAIEDNQFSKMWVEVGSKLPRPSAIIVLSAHWVTRGSYITAMPKPKMIYDFYGFPEELYHVEYPAPGSPETAEQVSKMLAGMELDHEWGLDHGAWSVLTRMFPRANIPVLQMSIDYNQSPEEEYENIKQLRSLREKGVMFIGSGNIVHNLRMARISGNPYNWAIDFDKIARDKLEERNYLDLVRYEQLGKVSKLAIPTDEHYRPMLLTLGLSYDFEHPVFFNEDIDASSVSMRSFVMKK